MFNNKNNNKNNSNDSDDENKNENLLLVDEDPASTNPHIYTKFEKSANLSLLALASNTGLGSCPALRDLSMHAYENQEEYDDLLQRAREEILSRQVTDADVCDIITRYLQARDHEAPLYACAACGIRLFHSSGSDTADFKRHKLSSLGCLQCPKSAVTKINAAGPYRNAFSFFPQNSPTEATATTPPPPYPRQRGTADSKNAATPASAFSSSSSSSSIPSSACSASTSSSCSPISWGIYHLHPELVDPPHTIDGFTEASALLCTSCTKAVRAKSIPCWSLASGMDFGWLRRLGIPELTPLEQMAVAAGRVFLRAYHVSGANAGSGEQPVLRGQCITFPQPEGPQIIVRAGNTNFTMPSVSTTSALGPLLRLDLHQLVHIQSLGPRSQWTLRRSMERPLAEITRLRLQVMVEHVVACRALGHPEYQQQE